MVFKEAVATVFLSSTFNAVDHIFLAGGVAVTDGLAALVENRLATLNPFTNTNLLICWTRLLNLERQQLDSEVNFLMKV